MLKDLSSSDAWTDESPRFINFGLLVKTASRVNFIQQRKYMSAIDLLDSLIPITLLKVGAGSLCLAEIPLIEVWSGWTFLTSSGPMVPLGLPIFWLPILVGETEGPPLIQTGVVILGEASVSVSVPWNHPVRVLPVYHYRILENTHAAARCVRDDLLQGNILARMQSNSTCHNSI